MFTISSAAQSEMCLCVMMAVSDHNVKIETD
jgi:hypothetical protein